MMIVRTGCFFISFISIQINLSKKTKLIIDFYLAVSQQ